MSLTRLKRLEALGALATRLAGESSGGVVADALEMLLGTTGARAGAAFAGHGAPEPLAERGLSSDAGRGSRLRSVLGTLVRRVIGTRRGILARDVRRPLPDGEDAGEFVAGELVASGYTALLASPIEHRRTILGVVVLLFEDGRSLDDETSAFVDTVAGMLALAIDRDRRLEQDRGERDDLAEAGRRAGLGVLTASLAHELRGPTGAIGLQLEEQRRLIEQIDLLAGQSDPVLCGAVSELSELTGELDGALGRLKGTVDQLTLLGRRDSSPENLDFGAVVRDSLGVMKSYLERRGISIVERIDSGCFTQGRRDNLGQVVLNLLMNAAEACESSVRPQVSVRTVEEGDRVVLIVDDTGPGVPAEQVKTIFRPFYTTKRRGQGAGMGLKICSDVVAAHGGHIEVVNRAQGGASFRVVLPKVDDQSGVHPVARASTPSEPSPMTVRRKILIVEDDPVFSRSVRRALKSHDVRVAATASEAEISLLDPSYEPDLVLCDVFLPGINGDVLHTRIAGRRPAVARRFVFMTGGGLGKAEADYLRLSSCRTLAKPFELKEILECLDAADNDSVPPNSVRTLNPPSPRPARASSLPPTPRH